MSLTNITAAVDECIRENILRKFFTAHREEAIKVGTLEQDFQLIIDANKEGYEEMLADIKNKMNSAIAEKDSAIAEKNATIAEKDSAIADIKKKMNSAITEKDADIARLKELLDAANIKY